MFSTFSYSQPDIPSNSYAPSEYYLNPPPPSADSDFETSPEAPQTIEAAHVAGVISQLISSTGTQH